jgi:demethylmenaquinone methyltransferase/2-methoxy-6-polyprenyl-1,4-benzoquinol methylase
VPGIDKLYELYSFNVIPAIGRAVTGDREAYQYLVESIRKFPKPKVFAQMIETAGFRRVSFTQMTGGMVALHSGWRL